MKITILGSCGGAEPIHGRKHTSIILEHENKLFWFDAGEGCSYTAHLMGKDLLATKAIFISHTHMDHIGGLPNLLWNIRKLISIKGAALLSTGNDIQVYIPDLSIWNGILQVLKGTEGGFNINFSLIPIRMNEGVVFEEKDIKVETLHNTHLGSKKPEEGWKSFSFCISVGEKRIVYSGDVTDISEIKSLLGKTDLLLMETGHHKVEDVCNYLKNKNVDFGQLVFVHHGRAIISNKDYELEKAKRILGEKVIISEDGMEIEL